jgi:hypothetical protein
MNDATLKPDTQEIVVDELFPHAAGTIWTALTTGELISRWLLMRPTGFAPVKARTSRFRRRRPGRGTASSAARSWR